MASQPIAPERNVKPEHLEPQTALEEPRMWNAKCREYRRVVDRGLLRTLLVETVLVVRAEITDDSVLASGMYEYRVPIMPLSTEELERYLPTVLRSITPELKHWVKVSEDYEPMERSMRSQGFEFFVEHKVFVRRAL